MFFLWLATIFGLFSNPALSAKISTNKTNQGFFSLYDRRDIQFNRNALLFKDFNYSVSNNGHYEFGNFARIQDYDEKPVLFVYQPDESIKELHGYFFCDGIFSLFYKSRENNTKYQLIRDYFNGSTEAVTPYAAKYAYPYFFQYPLVNIDASEIPTCENPSPNFAVMFAAPKHLRAPDADKDYIEIIRNNFYKTPLENFDVLYIVYGKDFCPYLTGKAATRCALLRK